MDHLSWADRHLHAVEASIADFMGKYPYTIRPGDDYTFDEVPMVMSIGPFVPDPNWVFQIGDALHNMRIALDYLAFQIAAKNGVTASEDKIAFPICDDPQTFASTTGRTLKGINPDVLKEIEALQPYQGRGREQLLAALSRLENVHKHRHPLAAFPGVDSFAYWIDNDPQGVVKVVDINRPDGPLVDGTEVQRIRFNGNSQAEVKHRITYQIFFDETVAGTKRLAVIRSMKHIRDFVRDVVFKKLDQFA